LQFSALQFIAALSPRVHDASVRQRSAQVFCASAWQTLPGYLLASILISAVLSRIVAISAESYGLSHLALEAIISVFVVEILPLVSTLFVVMRAVPSAMQQLAAESWDNADILRLALPYSVGNFLAVLVLTVIGGIISLLVAYLVVHGFTLWAWPAYARLIGEVFDPILSIAFLIKLCLFALAVGIAPTTLLLESRQRDAGLREMRVMVRLLLLLVAIEGSFLLLRID
jgi:phospholipid/cholesterol/gamma-HCH transport system permease protein